MPDSLIIDNLVTFLLAGHETTAQALTWTLYLLALFPDWQDRARKEIRRVIGNGPINREKLQQLSLVEAIFQEAMRLYPPAPSLMRRAARAVKLGGHDIKRGATVIIPIYVVHRHERLWHEPLRFDPARFSAEAKSARHRCAYMPFGTGPRSCIGGAFSMLEAKTMLATLLAGAKFELPEWEVPEPLARTRPMASHPCLRSELEVELILDVERLGARRLVVGVERDLLDLGFGLAQQRIAMGFRAPPRS